MRNFKRFTTYWITKRLYFPRGEDKFTQRERESESGSGHEVAGPSRGDFHCRERHEF
jgi:hypothetical protein